jgi:hypothetical protein
VGRGSKPSLSAPAAPISDPLRRAGAVPQTRSPSWTSLRSLRQCPLSCSLEKPQRTASGSRAAVVARSMLGRSALSSGKCRVRPSSYAWCQKRSLAGRASPALLVQRGAERASLKGLVAWPPRAGRSSLGSANEALGYSGWQPFIAMGSSPALSLAEARPAQSALGGDAQQSDASCLRRSLPRPRASARGTPSVRAPSPCLALSS